MIIWTKIGSTFALAMTGAIVIGDIAQSTLSPSTQLLTCPDVGSFILRVDNAGTLTTVTNSGGL